MIIKINRVETARPNRGDRTNHHGRPAVYFFLEGENLMSNILDRRNRPYNEFKKVLDQALEMAGLSIKGSDLGWSQYAGCTCPCSPGFIAKNAPLPCNVYVYYSVEEGEMPAPERTYSKRELESAVANWQSWPEPKDHDRARGLKKMSDAEKMAKLITDPNKIVRRLRAVVQHCAYELRNPFVRRMQAMGFSDDQIARVLGVKKSVKVLMPALA